MSTPWRSAASKLASVLPGSMCAAPLWPTRRMRLRLARSSRPPWQKSSERCRSYRASPGRRPSGGAQLTARGLDLLDGGLRADIGREHDERQLVDQAREELLAPPGRMRADHRPDRAGERLAGKQRAAYRGGSGARQQLREERRPAASAGPRSGADFEHVDERDPQQPRCARRQSTNARIARSTASGQEAALANGPLARRSASCASSSRRARKHALLVAEVLMEALGRYPGEPGDASVGAPRSLRRRSARSASRAPALGRRRPAGRRRAPRPLVAAPAHRAPPAAPRTAKR